MCVCHVQIEKKGEDDLYKIGKSVLNKTSLSTGVLYKKKSLLQLDESL